MLTRPVTPCLMLLVLATLLAMMPGCRKTPSVDERPAVVSVPGDGVMYPAISQSPRHRQDYQELPVGAGYGQLPFKPAPQSSVTHSKGSRP